MKKYRYLSLTIAIFLFIGCSASILPNEIIEISEENASPLITKADIDTEGHLLIELSDGSIIDVGSVRGEKGDKGDKGDPGQDGIDGKDGMDGSAGKDGLDGKDGKDGSDGQSGYWDNNADSGTINIANLPVGYAFPCNPNLPFDFMVSSHSFAVGTMVHIDSISIVLAKKNNTQADFDLYALDPSRSQYSSFAPYIIAVNISGRTDPIHEGNYVNIGFMNSGIGIWGQGKILSDGTFNGRVECPYAGLCPTDIWVHDVFIAKNPGGG